MNWTNSLLSVDVDVCMCRENELHKSMASLQRMSDATESVCECLLRLQRSLKEEEPLFGDVQTVQVLTNEHRVCLCPSIPLYKAVCKLFM